MRRKTLDGLERVGVHAFEEVSKRYLGLEFGPVLSDGLQESSVDLQKNYVSRCFEEMDIKFEFFLGK